MSMMNLMEIQSYQAFIQYDPEIEMFRGEFIGLNGGADFYAKDVDSLYKEGALSLKIYLEMCEENNLEIQKNPIQKLTFSPQLYQRMIIAAKQAGKNLDQWINDTLQRAI